MWQNQDKWTCYLHEENPGGLGGNLLIGTNRNILFQNAICVLNKLEHYVIVGHMFKCCDMEPVIHKLYGQASTCYPNNNSRTAT